MDNALDPYRRVSIEMDTVILYSMSKYYQSCTCVVCRAEVYITIPPPPIQVNPNSVPGFTPFSRLSVW